MPPLARCLRTVLWCVRLCSVSFLSFLVPPACKGRSNAPSAMKSGERHKTAAEHPGVLRDAWQKDHCRGWFLPLVYLLDVAEVLRPMCDALLFVLARRESPASSVSLSRALFFSCGRI